MSTSLSSNVISTWILTDDADSASTFPQAGRRSSADAAVHAIYWRCVAVFFAVARKTAGIDDHLRLYTGSQDAVEHADPFVGALLRELRVEVQVVPLTYLPPPGYYGRFRNQFYIFDILEAIAREDTERNHLVLDSDCLCLRPLAPMFRQVEEKRALTLSVGYSPDQDINGITRRQMQQIFTEMSGSPLSHVPPYYGGEFYASTSSFIREVTPLAATAWSQSLERFRQNKIKLNEEAHMLSYLFDRLGVEANTADPFMKRLWTGLRFRNGVPQDASLAIVHLPSEKRYGFVELYELIQDKNSWFYLTPVDERWVRRIQTIMGVPRPSAMKMLAELKTQILEKIKAKLG